MTGEGTRAGPASCRVHPRNGSGAALPWCPWCQAQPPLGVTQGAASSCLAPMATSCRATTGSGGPGAQRQRPATPLPGWCLPKLTPGRYRYLDLASDSHRLRGTHHDGRHGQPTGVSASVQ